MAYTLRSRVLSLERDTPKARNQGRGQPRLSVAAPKTIDGATRSQESSSLSRVEIQNQFLFGCWPCLAGEGEASVDFPLL